MTGRSLSGPALRAPPAIGACRKRLLRFSLVGCDGEIAAVEKEELIALVHRSRALKSLSPVQLTEINIRIVERLRDNQGALREACAALPNEMRLPLFAHALDLVLADGDLTEDEADFLNALILYLNLDGQSVEQIADVMTLKNRF